MRTKQSSGRARLGRGWLALLALLALAGAAWATPIQPNLNKLLQPPPPSRESYVPARAGWNGPEKPAVAINPMLAYLMHQPSHWEEFASLAVPDPRLVLLLGAAIVLLRLLRRREQREQKDQEKKQIEVLPLPSPGEEKAA